MILRITAPDGPLEASLTKRGRGGPAASKDQARPPNPAWGETSGLGSVRGLDSFHEGADALVDRLEGRLDGSGHSLGSLVHLGDVGFEGALGPGGLQLDSFLDALGGGQAAGGGGLVFEALLRERHRLGAE